MAVSPSQLTATTRLLLSLLRAWPFQRGRWRLERLLEPLMTIPDLGTFAFYYGTFVDTPLAAWPNGYRELLLHGSMDHKEFAVWRRLISSGNARRVARNRLPATTGLPGTQSRAEATPTLIPLGLVCPPPPLTHNLWCKYGSR